MQELSEATLQLGTMTASYASNILTRALIPGYFWPLCSPQGSIPWALCVCAVVGRDVPVS